MNKELLTFLINQHAHIRIQQPSKNYIFDYYDESYFLFQYYNHQYKLEKTNINVGLDSFKKYLNKGLQNQLNLDSYLAQNVGYYWNHSLNKKNISDRFDQYYEQLSYHILFGSSYTAFLYNNKQGDIIFEITPLYPEVYSYGKKKPSYGYFLKWMKSYKPLFKTIIPRNTAEEWIAQAQQILDAIDENSKTLHEQGLL